MPKKGSEKAGKIADEFRAGNLRSGSGDKVTKRKQAVSIGLSEQRTKDAQDRTEKRLRGKPV